MTVGLATIGVLHVIAIVVLFGWRFAAWYFGASLVLVLALIELVKWYARTWVERQRRARERQTSTSR